MMTRQARPSTVIMGLDIHMILEAVPAPHSKQSDGHQGINQTSRHYAEALVSALPLEGLSDERCPHFASCGYCTDDSRVSCKASVHTKTFGRLDSQPLTIT
jgi:hypothetical protein